MKRTIALLTLVAFLLAGCSTLVRIDSNAPDTRVTINDEYVGKTPVQTSLSDDAFKTYSVKLESPGYRTLRTELRKELKVGTLIGSLLLFWPTLFWVYGPVANQSFELEPIR